MSSGRNERLVDCYWAQKLIKKHNSPKMTNIPLGMEKKANKKMGITTILQKNNATNKSEKK
jgi:hypothetical protein